MSEINWPLKGRRPFLDALIFPPDDMQSVVGRALLDTGATVSAITRGIADRLNLPVLGKRVIGSAHGDQPVDRYIFRIGLIAREGGYPFIFEAVDGFQIRDGLEFDAIIGMDVLSKCDLALTRDGQCRLRFG